MGGGGARGRGGRGQGVSVQQPLGARPPAAASAWEARRRAGERGGAFRHKMVKIGPGTRWRRRRAGGPRSAALPAQAASQWPAPVSRCGPAGGAARTAGGAAGRAADEGARNIMMFWLLFSADAGDDGRQRRRLAVCSWVVGAGACGMRDEPAPRRSLAPSLACLFKADTPPPRNAHTRTLASRAAATSSRARAVQQQPQQPLARARQPPRRRPPPAAAARAPSLHRLLRSSALLRRRPPPASDASRLLRRSSSSRSSSA